MPHSFRGRGRGAFRGRLQVSPYNKPIIDSHAEWKTWPELTVKVLNLPRDTNVPEVYGLVLPFGGKVIKVAISDNQYQGKKYGAAVVTFCPPPASAFWLHDSFASTEDGGSVRAEIIQRAPVVGGISSMSTVAAELSLKAGLLSFGFLLQPDVVAMMRSVRADQSGPIKFELKNLENSRREAVIYFSLPLTLLGESPGPGNADFKVVMPFQQMREMWIRALDQDGPVDLIIPNESPAKFYRKVSDVSTTMEQTDRHWTDNRAWLRQIDISDQHCHNVNRQLPLCLRKEAAPLIDIGAWTTFVLRIPRNNPALRLICDTLNHYNVKVNFRQHVQMTTAPDLRVWDFVDGPQDTSFHDTVSDLVNLNPTPTSLVRLSYPVRYQLEACMSENVINPYNVSLDFLNRLTEMPEKQVLRRLEFVTDRGKRIYDPMDLFSVRIPRGAGLRSIPRFCTLQRAVTVTPSSLYFSSPTVEVSNRVIREYKDQEDRFLRVRFTDEKLEGKIFSTDDETNDVLYNRVRRCLLQGIRIGDRHYDFVAPGNSQLREHGAFFFARTPTLTAARIRHLMGDFRDMRVVAKFIARMGQCFSTTMAFNSSNVEIKEIEDVTRGEWNFTDGVGIISSYLAQLIASELRLDKVPSAFQFRLGGFKGVLAVSSEASGKCILMRPSQYKFPSRSERLEIIRPAKNVWAQLNRQLITLLSSLGIEDRVFIKKMQKQLEGVNAAMVNEEVALDQFDRRVDPNFTTLAMARIMRDGFMRARDPFAMSILHLWRSWVRKGLKEKANVHIERAAFVMGISDETKTLRGHSDSSNDKLPQIFLQIDHPSGNRETTIVKGTCVLMRNPSLHPGDVRTVKAIDCPRLHHLKNVVVFPQLGDRDIPFMCSGGDLDGDDFFVSWDPKLIPAQNQRNLTPMVHHPTIPQMVKDKVELLDIVNFYVTYMKQDSLGKIANAWIACADVRRLEGGPKHPDCVALAQEHSVAVDFLKTGKPASGAVLRQTQPRLYPHYMESSRRPKYHSTSAVGKLFDLVDRVPFEPDLELSFDQRVMGAYEDFPAAMVEQVRNIKHGYDSAMRRVMNQYEIDSEFEIWTGFILRHSKSVKAYEIQTTVGGLADQIKEAYRDECTAIAGQDPTTLYPFIAAMYAVTAKETSDFMGRLGTDLSSVNPQERPIISFPWIFYRELGRIAKRAEAQSGAKVHMHDIAAVRSGNDTRAGSSGVADDRLALDPADDSSPASPSRADHTEESASSTNSEEDEFYDAVEHAPASLAIDIANGAAETSSAKLSPMGGVKLPLALLSVSSVNEHTFRAAESPYIHDNTQQKLTFPEPCENGRPLANSPGNDESSASEDEEDDDEVEDDSGPTPMQRLAALHDL